ncbi:retrovirus-related Pol polyprotein from transposon 297 [Trichonephila clavipes]|nr:retrovirus-related Pol polyprotein from transposon 297 [Trichonephila clavipes]
MEINGIDHVCLRDSGSSIDVCSRSWINQNDLLGEYVWLKSPLDEICHCLPLAKIKIKTKKGEFYTKAAIKQDSSDNDLYLLGNRTAELLESDEQGVQLVNAVVTRSKQKRFSPEKEKEANEEELELTDFSPSEGREDDSFIIPAFEGEGGKRIDKEFRVIRGKLVRVAKTKRGEEVRQLCVPIKFRLDINKLSHDEIGGHLGVTKTKDRILRHFFWPNVYRDVEEFVKTCDSCQRVGKPRDKAKAPLKLVPIILEVFSKINIDAVGPLPVSTKQNRYLITSICVASKYPEAIPVESITSPNVIDALLSIFSRLGFPREIQSDLGTSFTSELTTTFFNKFGIKVTRSSVSHPQSNAVERVHRTIKRVIKALCVESGEDWEGVLPLALFSLRTVAHESTGFSPTELVMGKNLRTPQTLVYEEWMEEGNTSQSVVEYILQLNNRLKRCQDIAITRMKECQLKRKTWYDRDAVERKFVEGDLLVSLVVEEVSDDIEGDAEIPYPDKQCTKFDHHGILRESQLQLKLSPSQIDELKQDITKNKDVFSPDPGTTHLMRMDIELISYKPIKTKPYRMSPRQINILREEIKRLLELGVIEIGQSDYTSPLILVESPSKDPRPCVDYRRLNEITRAEFFPLPNMEEIVEKVSAAPYVTVMDLSKGYFQILLTLRAQRYAAFVTPFGTYIPKKMMFGLVCAPYYFCKLMAQVLEGLEPFALPYIDDIAIFSQGRKDHVKHIDIVLGRLRKVGLKVKPSKCKFAQEEVLFLGHRIGSGSRSPSDLKIKAIADFPRPTTKTQVRSFLGLVGYYSHYIPNYSTIASPLTDALKGKIKKDKITWDEKCGKAFEELKAKLVSQPILFAPDFATDFILQTDASEVGKIGRKKRKREREKGGKRAGKRQGLVVLGSGEENPRVLLGDADQESETRMSKNALRTGRRQAVEPKSTSIYHHYSSSQKAAVGLATLYDFKSFTFALFDWLPLASFHIHQSPPPARHRARGRAFHQGQGHFPTFHEMVLNNEGNSREDQQPTLSVFAVKLSLEGCDFNFRSFYHFLFV